MFRAPACMRHIDHLIRSEEVEDLAAVARMCGVSRARASTVVGLVGMPMNTQETIFKLNLAPSTGRS